MKNKLKMKNTTTAQTLLYYRKKIIPNSIVSKVLNLLYSEKEFTLQQIAQKIDESPSSSHHYIKTVISRMISNGYIQGDSKKYNKKYKLTKIGRWFAMCGKLEISFQSLCILAKVYAMVKKYDKYYLISMYSRNYDSSWDDDDHGSCASAIYSTSNISRSINMLIQRYLVYWKNNGMLKITPLILKRLEEYHDSLILLSVWNDEILSKCRENGLEKISMTPTKLKLLSMITQRHHLTHEIL